MLSSGCTRFDVLLKELAVEHHREIEALSQELLQHRAQASTESVLHKSAMKVEGPLLDGEDDVKNDVFRHPNQLLPTALHNDVLLQEPPLRLTFPADETTQETEMALETEMAGQFISSQSSIIAHSLTFDIPRSGPDSPGESVALSPRNNMPHARVSIRSSLTPTSTLPSDGAQIGPGMTIASTLASRESMHRRPTTCRLKASYGMRSVFLVDDEDVLSESESESDGGSPGSLKRSATATSVKSTKFVGMISRSHPWGAFPLHPESKASIVWICASVLLLFYDILMLPLQAFDLEMGSVTTNMNLICTLFWTVDILRTSICGFYNKEGELVLTHRVILLNYLRTWLLFDLLLAVFDWLLLVEGGRSFNSFARFLRSGRIMRLFRLAKIFNFIHAIEERFSSEFVSVVWTIAKQFVGIIVLNHFLACAWYKIGNSDSGMSWVTKYLEVDASFAYRYSTSLHWAFAHFINTNLEIYPTNLGERMYGLFTILLGLVVASTFISTITSAIVHLGELQKKQRKTMWMLRKYLAATGVPTSLVLQIQNYCESALGRLDGTVLESNVEALKVLSTPLRRELRVTMVLPVLRKHNVFDLISNTESYTIEKICDAGTSKASFLQHDHIFSVGDACNEMHFGIRGSFSYQRARGLLEFAPHTCESTSVDFHIDEHNELTTWCEASLWTTWTHCGTLAVNTDCEVIILDSTVFGECVGKILNQFLFRRVCAYAKAFVQALDDDRASDDLFSFDGSDIVFKNKRSSKSSATSKITVGGGVVSKFANAIIPFTRLAS